MEIQFQEGIQAEITCVPNAFIDEYVAEANGDYVKVYLYLLRHQKEKIKGKEIGEALCLTDQDVKRAILFWEKKGVLKEGTARALERELQSEEAALLSEEKLSQKERLSRMERTSFFGEQKPAMQEKKREIDEEEFGGILFVAKHLMPVVTPSHVRLFEDMYQSLEMDAELIEFFLDYCCSIQKTNCRYMQKVAVDWHELGIRDVRAAREHVKNFDMAKGMKSGNGEGKYAGNSFYHKGKSGNASGEKKSNRFLNFSQDEVDYDSLAKQKALERLGQFHTTK